MDNEEYLKNGYDAVYLLRCFLSGTSPDEERIKRMDLGKLFSFAERHKISAFLGSLLKDIDPDNPWEQEVNQAIYRTMLFDSERRKIYSFLEKKGIWYVGLKGIVLSQYYPQFGLRQMSDNDILFDNQYAESVKDYMTSNGYSIITYGQSHHDSYSKPPVFHFEMHRSLFDYASSDRIVDYYAEMEKKLIRKSDDSCELLMGRDDFYVYFIAHALKHFENGGTGLRTLCDLYVYSKAEELDWKYIGEELKKINCRETEEMMRSLTYKLFEKDEPLSGDEENMLSYLFSSGAYGTISNKVTNTMKKEGIGNGRKYLYLIKRIFPDEQFIRAYHPFFYRHKLLYPLLLPYRIIRMFTVRRKKVIAEIKALKNIRN